MENKVTIEKIKEFFKDDPFCKHYENKSLSISIWTFGYDGDFKIHTGDGGAKLMYEQILKDIKSK